MPLKTRKKKDLLRCDVTYDFLLITQDHPRSSL
jgi:hypothetical protein